MGGLVRAWFYKLQAIPFRSIENRNRSGGVVRAWFYKLQAIPFRSISMM
jgi:hypothetical protein